MTEGEGAGRYLDLKEVLRGAVDLLERLLPRVGHGLHDSVCEVFLSVGALPWLVLAVRHGAEIAGYHRGASCSAAGREQRVACVGGA